MNSMSRRDALGALAIGGAAVVVAGSSESVLAQGSAASAARYVDAFVANVNWDEVNRRLGAAHAAGAALRPAAARKP